MMIRLFGTAVRFRISMLVRNEFRIWLEPGIMRALAPVAMMMFFVLQRLHPGIGLDFTLPPPLSGGIAGDSAPPWRASAASRRLWNVC
jgi:hypothetical protein